MTSSEDTPLDKIYLRLDFDEDGIWLIEHGWEFGHTQVGHVSWAVIARHIHPHLEYYDMKKKVMKDE